jgi:hypothetical protein
MKVWKRMRHTLSVPDASGGMDVSNVFRKDSPRRIDGVRVK